MFKIRKGDMGKWVYVTGSNMERIQSNFVLSLRSVEIVYVPKYLDIYANYLGLKEIAKV